MVNHPSRRKQSKYADLPPKQHGNWRDSFTVRTLDTSSTPGLVLIEVKVAGHAFQLYPNEFAYLKAAMNDYPFTAED